MSEWKPGVSTANGNCLFNSVSRCMYGHERFHDELRVRTAVVMFNNASTLCSDEFLSKAYGRKLSPEEVNHLLLASTPMDDCNEHVVGVQQRAHITVKQGSWCGMLEILAMSQFLEADFLMIYPCQLNPFTQVDLFSGSISGSTCCAKPELVVISWTHVSDENADSGTWAPNHFVPCFPSDTGML